MELYDMEYYDYAIGIPTVNQWPMLREHLHSYAMDMPDIAFVIVDNGNQGITMDELPNGYQFKVLSLPVNIGVAASWNVLLHYIFTSHEYALILNDDVYLGLNQREIQAICDEQEGVEACAAPLITGGKGFASFMLRYDTFQDTGDFDINYYPAYFEDNDYVERLKAAGYSHKTDMRLTPKVFMGSQSIAKDPTLNLNFEKNRQRFIDKWGFDPSK